jgi:hypothetical protein
MSPELAVMIPFGIFGICFFVAVWVVARRAHNEDERHRR